MKNIVTNIILFIIIVFPGMGYATEKINYQSTCTKKYHAIRQGWVCTKKYSTIKKPIYVFECVIPLPSLYLPAAVYMGGVKYKAKFVPTIGDFGGMWGFGNKKHGGYRYSLNIDQYGHGGIGDFAQAEPGSAVVEAEPLDCKRIIH